MRNCDARMTGEVHKRFHVRQRNWSVMSRRVFWSDLTVTVAGKFLAMPMPGRASIVTNRSHTVATTVAAVGIGENVSRLILPLFFRDNVR